MDGLDHQAGGGNRRRARLESLLKREIASVVTTELRDPRIGFVTITRCELTPDLQQVTAFYTIYGDNDARKAAARALSGAAPYVQGHYAKAVRMRHLPRLRFEYDRNEDRRNEMDALIARARATDPDADTASTAESDDSAS